ncbi:MAG: ABC transporter ATP-binding protein [Clostridia bacterium]|nr:ABC transporter ATP-binding protein [Clostridia bacterium]
MITVKNFTKSYGAQNVYNDFNLEIDQDKITCILGESGCGKTTLLNAVAGLINYGGEITKARVSYVFQTPRIIPNLTVEDNLKIIGAESNWVAHMLQRVGLSDKIKAYPNTLSGGEAQRVSLVRAFGYPSEILLMDEPFSSLDLKSKLSAMELVLSLVKEEGRGALFVTHDVDEALFLADRIVVLGGGKILSDIENAEKLPFGASSEKREEIIKALLGEDVLTKS